MRKLVILLHLVGIMCMGCSNTDDPVLPTDDSGIFQDGYGVCTDPEGDKDDDGISNAEEGCLTGRDSDYDGTPDWQDVDSDNDGIFDKIEAGEEGNCVGPAADKWPCDSDGDGLPDYLDIDSDGDRVLDKDEDSNGDGLLGCCINECGKPDDSAQAKDCILNDDGCGPGQECVNGLCSLPIDFKCSNGETSPKMKDTFNDGKFDGDRGTFICRTATEDNPVGRKKIQEIGSEKPTPDNPQSGDWRLALEMEAKYGKITIAEAKAKEAAAAIDHDDSLSEVAGFVISTPYIGEDIQGDLSEIINRLQAKTPGGTGSISVRASGIQGKSHDKYDAITGTILDLNLATNSNIATVRNELIATLLGHIPGHLTSIPAPYGNMGADFVIKLVTVRRFPFKPGEGGKLALDENGYPIDDTEAEGFDADVKRRTLVMGSVALTTNLNDLSRKTAAISDDLAGGTALAIYTDEVKDECDVGTITSLPVADIIWVIDESGSMVDERQGVVDNANAFFSRALASGLDFRMGVTNVVQPTGSNDDEIGHLCGSASSNASDPGDPDRFLLPSEQSLFSACINNPPGNEYGSEHGLDNAAEAVKKHLPRMANAQDKIRPGARIVIILATDEAPQELKNGILEYDDYGSTDCTLTTNKQTAVNAALKKYLDLFKGITDPEAAAVFHVLGGICNNSCGAEMAHGYIEMAQQLGGQVGDICQKNLGSTLQVIIDSIIGAASPVVLEYVPIASSLAVAVDGKEIERSRTNGFDYRAERNSLAFINIKFEKGSEVVASYKRWKRQEIIE